MKDNQFRELSDHFLSLVSGGTLNEEQKQLLDTMALFYLKTFRGRLWTIS